MLRKFLLSLISHRTAATLRWDLHFLGVRSRAKLQRVGNRIEQQIRASKQPLYLNLGSGPRGLASDHWVNIDGFSDLNVQHVVDFSRPLPIPDASFDGVFSEHVQEHFALEDGIEVLRECHRVLKPGGWLRLIMPDAEVILRAYLENPAELLGHRHVPSGQPMEVVNEYFRQRYEHQCLYDFALAKYACDAAGFSATTRAAFRSGACPPALMLDDEKYAWESLYIESHKA